MIQTIVGPHAFSFIQKFATSSSSSSSNSPGGFGSGSSPSGAVDLYPPEEAVVDMEPSSSSSSLSFSDRSDFTLRLRYAEAQDEGDYECQVKMQTKSRKKWGKSAQISCFPLLKVSTDPKISKTFRLRVVGEYKWAKSIVLLIRLHRTVLLWVVSTILVLYQWKSFCLKVLLRHFPYPLPESPLSPLPSTSHKETLFLKGPAGLVIGNPGEGGGERIVWHP